MATQQLKYGASQQVTTTASRIRHITFNYETDTVTVHYETGDDSAAWSQNSRGSFTLTLSDYPTVKADADAMATKALNYMVNNSLVPSGTLEDI